MKKNLLLVTASLLALGAAAPAVAADLGARPYAKAPPPVVAPIYNWSGFYIGINGGYGTSRKCWDLVTAGGALIGAEGCHDATGGTIGGQLGYRWQAANWVFGLEGQGNWADFSGSNTSLVSGFTNRSRIDAFGLFTGQVGYSFSNVLLYVKGGGAVVGDQYDIFTAGGGLLGGADETRWGGTVGVGAEFAFSPNWSLGLEYNHIFLGDRNIAFTTVGGAPFGIDRISQDVDMGLVRLNYKFGGPVVAKY